MIGYFRGEKTNWVIGQSFLRQSKALSLHLRERDYFLVANIHLFYFHQPIKMVGQCLMVLKNKRFIRA